MLRRISLIFGVTTEVSDRDSASPHSGGWSESYWDNSEATITSFVPSFARIRAALLPKQAAVIGYRVAVYTIQGNRLIPGGTSSSRILCPGRSSLETDLPQVAVQMSMTGPAGNASRMTLRGMPDDVMVKGEYQPDAAFKRLMTLFTNQLVEGNWGFVGRNLALPTQRVLSITAGGVATLAGPSGAGEGDYVRLLRVTNNDGDPVTGVFRVTVSIDGGTVVTLANWPAGVTVGESGRIRKDEVAYVDITAAAPSRAVVRKIGSPTERYRGRASKRTR